MTVPDLMSALRAHGATLMLQGDSVKVTAPAPLPDALTVALRAHKADIVAALQGQASQAPAALPPVHDTDDPWEKPSASCAACGAVHWRVWCHDERKVWQWICNRCRPLVVVHKDGRIEPGGQASGGQDDWVPLDELTAEWVDGPPCWTCKGTRYWLRPAEAGAEPVCARCHPPSGRPEAIRGPA